MSVVSSRISSVSSILKSMGAKSQIVRQTNRVYFKLPKDIKTIICNFDAGKGHKEYEELIHLLRENAVKDSDLVEFLTEARQCVSLLSSKYKLLVEILLQIKWTDKSPEVASIYKLFLEDLVCIQTCHTKTVIDHLVELFKPAEDNNAERIAGEFKDEDIERLNHIHDMLHQILKIMPMSSKLLLQSLVSQFPYIVHGTYTHEVYIHALLQILDYTPQLRSDILSLIINRLMVLDVNIPYKEKNDDEADDLMDIDNSYNETTDDNNATSNATNNDADKVEDIHPMAYTLDACMELFLKYMHEFCFADGILQIESLKILYFEILRAFETVILPTHASRYVQYIAFYICSFKAVVAETFVDRLWREVTNPNAAPVIRQSAVCYIASLLATASFINLRLVKLTFCRLAKWIHNYIVIQECTNDTKFSNDDAKTHVVFYSVCQAFCYLFIARHKDFIRTKNNILFLQELDIPKIITCILNPLKMCDNEIVHNFADITRTYQLAYCYAIIENNTRNRLPTLEEDIHSSISIPSFFPFKSYTLRHSGQRIVPLLCSNEIDMQETYRHYE